MLTVKFRPGQGRRLDYVYLYVYVPGRKRGFITAPVYRYDKKITFMVSDYFAGYEAHAYLMAMSDDGRWSESHYCGTIHQGEEITDVDSHGEDGGMLSAVVGGNVQSPSIKKRVPIEISTLSTPGGT